MSSIGRNAEAERQAHGVAKVAIAEVTSVQSQVEIQIAMLAENVEANTSCAIGEMSPRLEHGLETVALGKIIASMQNTQAVVEALSREPQAKQNQYRWSRISRR